MAERESKVAIVRACGIVNPMKSLGEIERAAEQLPNAQQTELLYFLAQRLDQASAPPPPPREFSAEQMRRWMDEDEADMRRFASGQ